MTPLVKVVAAESVVSPAVARHFKYAVVADFKNGYVEGTAAEVVIP